MPLKICRNHVDNKNKEFLHQQVCNNLHLFQCKRSLKSNSDRMVLWGPSPPSSRPAGFVNKVIIPCPNSLSFHLLRSKKQVPAWTGLTGSKSVPLHNYGIISDPSLSLLNKHPYFFPIPVLTTLQDFLPF